MKKPLSRRTVLKGIGGMAVALPALEAMFAPSTARASTVPKRYVVCFNGQSLGADNDPLHNEYFPNKLGADYDLKAAIAPLAPVKNEVSVVSGLKIPWAKENGGVIPPGGKPDDWHVYSGSPLLSGVRATTRSARCEGPTSDQLVAEAIGQGTLFPSLVYRVQAGWYLSVSSPSGRDLMSYKRDSVGKIVPIPGTVSPKQAFDQLFANFKKPVDPAEIRQRDWLLRSRKSILDLVRQSTGELMPQLGTADRARMERHFDEIRDLERRVAAISLPVEPEGACRAPADPGPDPALGGAQGGSFSTNNGYSNEEQRAKTFCDIIHMALACDLTRSVSLMMSMFQSHMNMYPLIGIANDLHEIGHSSAGTKGVSKGIAWHVKHYAYLVQKLRDTPEAGGSMLDNSVVLMLHEGGHGLDPSSGKLNSSHSSENMACLIAGRAGGLKPGRHIAGNNRHPASVVASAMQAVGVPGGLGEVKTIIPELFA
ncbi:MAG: DUF1552 domain-containing protein [Myxococcales bacterium]